MRFDDGSEDALPASRFFRGEGELDAIDRKALELCRGGRVLDVGAGAGAHSLPLQRRGLRVTALEVLPAAVAILGERGVRDARLESVWEHRPTVPYDAVLLLMNGTGVAGTLQGLGRLLGRVASLLLAPGGVVLVDSTDPGRGDPGDGRHPGEMQLQLEYRGRRGEPFPHLYLDAGDLAALCAGAGLSCDVVLEAGDGRYLAACVNPPRPRGSAPAR